MFGPRVFSFPTFTYCWDVHVLKSLTVTKYYLTLAKAKDLENEPFKRSIQLFCCRFSSIILKAILKAIIFNLHHARSPVDTLLKKVACRELSGKSNILFSFIIHQSFNSRGF